MAKNNGAMPFALWKDSRTLARKRAYYEAFPNKLWSDNRRTKLVANHLRICNKVSDAVGAGHRAHQDVVNLVEALRVAKNVPHVKKTLFALVGEQGIGKSSLCNAILKRDLLDVSAAGTACTSFATIIEFDPKVGPGTCNYSIQFQTADEQEEFLREQICRFADYYHPRTDRHSHVEEKGGKSSDKKVYPTTDRQEKTLEEDRRAAATARNVFSIIYNDQNDAQAKQELERHLKRPNIGDGKFLRRCVRKAQEFLTAQGIQNGNICYENVLDKELSTKRIIANQLWPLVRTVTIAIDSELGRNGISFIDLPGYGDLNQVRTAVVNEFRRTADAEIIVATSERMLDKENLDNYIKESIKYHSVDKTILVSNKKDRYMNDGVNEIRRKIETDPEEPFCIINEYLLELDISTENPELICEYKQAMAKVAQHAIITREADNAKAEMQKRYYQNLAVFSVSAAHYITWNDRHRLRDPDLDREMTGIPELQNHLLSFNAKDNYQTLHDHVAETLLDIQGHISCILEKHTGDDNYARMRDFLRSQIPTVQNNLCDLSQTLEKNFVLSPWTWGAKSGMLQRIDSLISSWSHQKIKYMTFSKMLRENGIPINGVAAGRNWNDELLSTMEGFLETWKETTLSKPKVLFNAMDAPVHCLLRQIQEYIDSTSDDTLLKKRATDAREKISRRIAEAKVQQVARLECAVQHLYLRYLTETDIYCPIARFMKPVYRRVTDVRNKMRIKGIQKLQLEELRRCITQPFSPEGTLPDKLEAAIGKRLEKLWEDYCQRFINSVTKELDDFARVTEDLLKNDNYRTSCHRLLRKKLNNLDDELKKDVADIKAKFPDPQPHRRSDAKRMKTGRQSKKRNLLQIARI